MEDFARLLFYVVIGVIWFLLQAKRPKGSEHDQPWEELPPMPKPRPAPSKQAPSPAPAASRTIAIGPKQETQLTLADQLERLAAQRAPVAAAVAVAPTPPAVPSWSLDLSTPNKIAEGIVLSAILGPPKASAYLRRLTRYWQPTPS